MSDYEQHIHRGNLKPERMPSEYESLRTEIERMGTSYVAYAAAVDRYAEVVNEQFASVWQDNAALRDELHALANRVETLTRARLTEPAATAARMVEKRHKAGSPMYREERDRFLIECSCGWEYESRSGADAELAYRRHSGEYAA